MTGELYHLRVAIIFEVLYQQTKQLDGKGGEVRASRKKWMRLMEIFSRAQADMHSAFQGSPRV